MHSFILRTTSSFLIGLLAVLSVFMVLRGHHEPGGGFVGGLLLAAGVALRLLSHGPDAARALLRVPAGILAAVGLAIAGGAGCVGLFTGGTLFSPRWFGEIPGVGEVGTVLLFDLGVYLVVAGTASRILLTLAEEYS